jgi:phosphoglycolate phosphatase
MRNFDLIVFDWDGTLMDSAAAIVHAIQSASRDLGYPEPSDERARHVIGLGLSDALRQAVPDLPEREYPRMAERYRAHYLASDDELSLFPGARELLSELSERAYLLAVATGKSRLGLDRALEYSGLRAHFHALRCADTCHSKPHPQMLLELMTELDTVPERTLMIGDTTHDLQMARNAGVRGLGVSYGAHPPEILWAQQPLTCAPTLSALRDWLRDNG